MKESKYYKIFRDKFLERAPDAFIYKIPDTGGTGGKRPFDTFVVVFGHALCIEFKSKNLQPTKYQDYQMNKFVVAGGHRFVFNETKTMDGFIDEIFLYFYTPSFLKF